MDYRQVYVDLGGSERYVRVFAHRGSELGEFLVWCAGWRWVAVIDCRMSSLESLRHEEERRKIQERSRG